MIETPRLVLPEDLNHNGHLFGGRLLAWVDEACWIAASVEFPQCQFVTIAMAEVEFRHAVRQGTILCIRCELEKHGKTSVTYRVEVVDRKDASRPTIFATRVTYVNVDEAGQKKVIA